MAVNNRNSVIVFDLAHFWEVGQSEDDTLSSRQHLLEGPKFTEAYYSYNCLAK